MATLPLVPQQMDVIIQQATIAMLGLTTLPLPLPEGVQDPAYAAVRVGWQQQGQPAQKIDEDVVYVRALEVDDQYNRIRDREYYSETTGSGGAAVTTYYEQTNYTRVWEVFWEFVGPTSFDHARLIRSSLFTHDQFAASQLYLVTDVAAPRRVPEQRDGQWWERTDFSARFNEFVTEILESQSVLSAEIILVESGVAIGDVNIVTDPPDGYAFNNQELQGPPGIGLQGPQGEPGANATVLTLYSFSPSPNGTNTVFTAPVAITPNALITVGGLTLTLGADYSYSGDQATFFTPPALNANMDLYQ